MTPKLDDMSSVLGTHIVEEDNWLSCIVFWHSYMLSRHIGTHLLPQIKSEVNVIKNKKCLLEILHICFWYNVAEKVMVWSICMLWSCGIMHRQGYRMIVEDTSVWNWVFLECCEKYVPHSLILYPHLKVNCLMCFSWINNNNKRTQGRFTAPDSRTRSANFSLGGKLDLRERWGHQNGNFSSSARVEGVNSHVVIRF